MCSDRNIVKEGYLVKSPPQNKLMAHWHRRYFVLWSSRLMEYYTSHEKKPVDYRKTIDLKNCEDMIAPLLIQNKGFVIKLTVNTGGQKIRDYLFECVSESDMNEWVQCLARVCGFTPVEEEETSNPLPSANQPPSINKPKLRAPLPPPKPSSPSSQQIMMNEPQQGLYEEIVTEGTYHMIEDGSESDDEPIDVQEIHYEDLQVDSPTLYDMNKHPPPIWKPASPTNGRPPPLPFPNRPPRKWSKSLERQSSDFEVIRSDEIPSTSVPLALPPRQPSGNDVATVQKRPLPFLPPSRPSSDGKVSSRSPEKENSNLQKRGNSSHGLRKTKPPPPTPLKPSKFGSSDNILSRSAVVKGMGVGIDISNDPKFGRKLQERRQEIYGAHQLKSRSWHEDQVMDDIPQGSYEEVEFHSLQETTPLTPPCRPAVKFGIDENDEGYIDCDPSDDQPQEYLDFEQSCRLLNDSAPPPLPKPTRQSSEEKKRQFLERPPLPIPPRDIQKPPLRSPIRESKGRTVREQSPVSKNPPHLKKAASTGIIAINSPPITAPPPLPSREVITEPHSNNPPPLPRRDVINPVVRKDSGEETPPPIPLRHPHASDKLRALSPSPTTTFSSRTPSPDNALPLPPRSKSPVNVGVIPTTTGPPTLPDRNAPPLPSRGPSREQLPPPPPPNRSISEPFVRHQRHPAALPPVTKSAPMSPRSDGGCSFQEEDEEEEVIFEEIKFGDNHNRLPGLNGLNKKEPPKKQPPPPVAQCKPQPPRQQQSKQGGKGSPQRKGGGGPPIPNHKPTALSNQPPPVLPKDRSKPQPPPVASKPPTSTAMTRKPPTAPKPKPGAGVPKPSSVNSPTRTAAAPMMSKSPRPRVALPPKPSLKPKPPLPPPKTVPGTA